MCREREYFKKQIAPDFKRLPFLADIERKVGPAQRPSLSLPELATQNSGVCCRVPAINPPAMHMMMGLRKSDTDLQR